MNGYDLSRQWFDFAFENPDLVTGNHTAVYLWNVELNNRMGWVGKFASPASQAMAASGIKSWNTYKKVFDQIVEWGFIEIIQESKNQYTANIIALSKNDKALDKALDKAVIKQSGSTIQSTDSIIKPLNQETNKQYTYVDDENSQTAQAVKKTFKAPTESEVQAYFKEKNECSEKAAKVFAEKFWSHYEANGWKVGKNKMQNWRLAITGSWKESGERIISENPIHNGHNSSTPRKLII